MRAFQIYGCTDTGAVRKVNEDHILIGRFVKNRDGLGMYFNQNDDFLINFGMLFAIADGIGGNNAGEIASKLALNAFDRQFYGIEKTDQDIDLYIKAIAASANRANETILQLASNKPELSGMGCTISGVCLMREGYLIYNAGDSRVYRNRNGILKPLTNDDTVTSFAVQSGHMSYQEAHNSDARNTLTNSLGSHSFKLKIEAGPEIRDNDIILICSDGLNDMVEHEQLENILVCNDTVEDIANRLVKQAIINGGHDNISVIVIRSDVFETSAGWHSERLSTESSEKLSINNKQASIIKDEINNENTVIEKDIEKGKS